MRRRKADRSLPSLRSDEILKVMNEDPRNRDVPEDNNGGGSRRNSSDNHRCCDKIGRRCGRQTRDDTKVERVREVLRQFVEARDLFHTVLQKQREAK